MAFESLTVPPRSIKINNWSHTFSCQPELAFEPTSIEEIQAIVNEARHRGRKIRPVGLHTSPGEAFCTKDWMMRMHRIDHSRVDVTSRTATLRAGLRLREANKIVYSQGLCFPTVGSIDEVAVGSLFAASAHGSSVRHASMADRVVSCKIVTADGAVRDLHRDSTVASERALFAATGCGCGATGVIVELTYELDKAFGLAPRYETMSVRAMLSCGNGPGGMRDIAARAEYVKIWYFPGITKPESTADDAIIFYCDKTDPPPIPPEPSIWEECQKRVIHFLHGLAVFICTFIVLALMPWFNKLQYALQSASLPTTGEPLPGYLAQQMDCMYWQLVEEFAVPFSSKAGFGAVQSLREWIDFIDNDPVVGKALTAPFEIRFSATAKTYHLSPLTHDSDLVLWLEPIIYRPLNLQVPALYHRMFTVFDGIARKHGGKPHLAKTRRPPVNDSELSTMYPRIADWRRIVKEVDPSSMFWSDFLQDQFGSQERTEKPEEMTKTMMGKQSALHVQA